MDTITSNSAETQVALAQKIFVIENQLKSGLNWFYLIAVLSIVNSIIYFTGGSLSFIIGLGATQFVDGFSSALSSEFNSNISSVIRIIGFSLDLFIAGLFVLCGVLGRKKFRWIVIFGMILYGLDALIFLALSQWLGVIFHLIALSGLWRGLKAINDYELLVNSNGANEIANLRNIMVEKLQPPRTNPEKARKNLIRFAVLAIVSVIALFFFMLIAFWVIQN